MKWFKLARNETQNKMKLKVETIQNAALKIRSCIQEKYRRQGFILILKDINIKMLFKSTNTNSNIWHVFKRESNSNESLNEK